MNPRPIDQEATFFIFFELEIFLTSLNKVCKQGTQILTDVTDEAEFEQKPEDTCSASHPPTSPTPTSTSCRSNSCSGFDSCRWRPPSPSHDSLESGSLRDEVPSGAWRWSAASCPAAGGSLRPGRRSDGCRRSPAPSAAASEPLKRKKMRQNVLYGPDAALFYAYSFTFLGLYGWLSSSSSSSTDFNGTEQVCFLPKKRVWYVAKGIPWLMLRP